MLHETFDCMGKAHGYAARVTGTPTGFDTYDWLTGGLHDGELTLLCGRRGMGTTSLVLGVALNVASPKDFVACGDSAEQRSEPGLGVLVFSLGMPRREVVNRMLCAEARVDISRVRTGMLSKADWEKLTQAAGRLSGLNIWVNDEPVLSPVDIRSAAARLKAEIERFDPATGERTYRLGLIVIDGWHRVRGRYRSLRALARELMVPIIATTTIHPVSEDRDGHRRPQLSDLPLSDDDADNICFLHRDSYCDLEADPEAAELIVASQRNGPTDTVRLRWEWQSGRFDNLPVGEPDDPA